MGLPGRSEQNEHQQIPCCYILVIKIGHRPWENKHWSKIDHPTFCANLLFSLKVQCMPLDQPKDHNQWWELGNSYIILYSHDDSKGCQQWWDNDVSGIAAKSKALIMYLILLQIFSLRWLTSTKLAPHLWMNTWVADHVFSNAKYEMFVESSVAIWAWMTHILRCMAKFNSANIQISEMELALFVAWYQPCSPSLAWNDQCPTTIRTIHLVVQSQDSNQINV